MKFLFGTTAIDAFRAALKVAESDNGTLQFVRIPDGLVDEIQATDGVGVVTLPAFVERIVSFDPGGSMDFDPLLLAPLNLKIPSGLKSGIDSLHVQLEGESFSDLAGWVHSESKGQKLGGMTAATGKAIPIRKVVPDALPILPAAPPYAFDAVHAANVLRAARTVPRYPITVQLPSGSAAFRWAFDGGGDYTIVCGRGTDDVEQEFKRMLELHRVARVGGRAYQEALEAEMIKKGGK